MNNEPKITATSVKNTRVKYKERKEPQELITCELNNSIYGCDMVGCEVPRKTKTVRLRFTVSSGKVFLDLCKFHIALFKKQIQRGESLFNPPKPKPKPKKEVVLEKDLDKKIKEAKKETKNGNKTNPKKD